MRIFKLTLVVTGIILIAGATGFIQPHSTHPYQLPELRYFPKMPVPENNPLTEEGVELGRYLFYDPILSRDSSFSCSSCHHQSAAFSDGPNRFSKGIDGKFMTRNTPALFNLAWQSSWFWDGRARSLEEQVLHPVREQSEMDLNWNVAAQRLNKNDFYYKKFQAAFYGQKIDSNLIAKAIAQFLRTLLSYQSKYDKVLRGEAEFTKTEYEGFVLINNQVKGNCLHCHPTDGDVLCSTFAFSNNGLDSIYDAKNYVDKGRGGITGKISDNGKFKIPSLRNVALTGPYMHDGRLKTLEEVIDFYSEGLHNSANIDSKMAMAGKGGLHLSTSEKQKIIAFLNTLTDSSFINNPNFSNPFKAQ